MERYLKAIVLFLVILSSFLFGALIERDQQISPDMFVDFKSNNEDCQGLNLEDSAECLWEEQGEFYNYNSSNIGIVLSLKELKEQGGVCSHYANWYVERGRELGFYSKHISMDINETIGHRIAVISDNTGYCIMEQNVYPYCQKLISK